MDYKSFVSNFNRVACVISVDLKQEDDNNRYFVVGACNSTETGDILKAMQRADARMYAVKEDYYMRHSKCELHS